MREEHTLLLEIAEQNKEIIYKDNKVLAKLSWLRQWEHNYKFSEAKDTKHLIKSIEEDTFYKPLIITLEDY